MLLAGDAGRHLYSNFIQKNLSVIIIIFFKKKGQQANLYVRGPLHLRCKRAKKLLEREEKLIQNKTDNNQIKFI
jgi:hypothetical protein